MGITIAAAITTIAVAVSYGYLIFRLSFVSDRRAFALALLVALPLQPLAFYLVRLPLHSALVALLGQGATVSFLSTLYAPLTEEPAKWLVLLIPAVRLLLRPGNAVPLALAIGLGFGIGEIWFLAHQVSSVPQFAALPFWAFTGFFVERFYVTFLHGGFILFAVNRLAHRRSFLPGALAGLALHYAVNLPLYLAEIAALGLSPASWPTIASLFALLVVAPLGFAMNRISRGKLLQEALGYSVCPGCGRQYPRPLIGLNLGPIRCERCLHCRKFHFVSLLARHNQHRDEDGAARITDFRSEG